MVPKVAYGSESRLLLRKSPIVAKVAYCCESRLLFRKSHIVPKVAYCSESRLLFRKSPMVPKVAYCCESRLLLRKSPIVAKVAYCFVYTVIYLVDLWFRCMLRAINCQRNALWAHNPPSFSYFSLLIMHLNHKSLIKHIHQDDNCEGKLVT